MICIKVKVCKLHNLECSIKRKELQNVCITNAQCNLTLAQMSQALNRAKEPLAGRAGRSYLQDLCSSQVSTLTRVVQVVVPSDGVVNWFGPLESLLDIFVVCFMIVLGHGPLCQVPFGRHEEANKVGRQVNVVLLFFS